MRQHESALSWNKNRGCSLIQQTAPDTPSTHGWRATRSLTQPH